jgi:apolipoprotein N-acyltransferase
VRIAAGVLASAALCALYARGGPGWLLGFVALVPWLRSLDATRTLAGSLLGAWAMSAAFTAAVFAWFGAAIGSYTQIGSAAGMAALLLGAPLIQPQFFAFALARRALGVRLGRAGGAVAAAAAWVAAEWLLPKLLGDTLGHGLHASPLLRQAADLGGAAGLTLLLLLCNEAVAAALAHRAGGMRAIARPLALAVGVPLALAAYGLAALAALPAPAGKPLRMGLVQSNIVDYERLRREKGAAAVVREVLDVHYAMSYDAVERQRADAVLWSETVYPTTFGSPKSDAGAELDREILGIVDAAGVPFVFGTYERDDAGNEYNAAAFVAPGSGLVGMYRKTRPFPLTERVPAWLDGPTLRRWLPWAGAWQAGSGARVFPLRLADGREIPVLPLICLDDMDAVLAVDGARLGAQALLVMSNDSWFAGTPQGAQLHLAASALRSVETRLPQFRVTPDGISAVIDRTGRVIAGSRIGERTLVVGEVPVGEPPRTLMVAWGDWVGRAAALGLLLLAALAAARAWQRRLARTAAQPQRAPALPADVAVLSPAARWAAGLLRGFARASLLGMGAAVLLGDDVLRSNTLAQIRTFAALFLAPELAAALLLRAFAARASIESGTLVFARGSRRRLELRLRDIVAVQPWRLPLPVDGVTLRLEGGERYGVAHADPAAFARALADAGGASSAPDSAYAQARRAVRRGRLDHPGVKFVLLPLLLATAAFRLHQQIAYGSSFGELHSFGLGAYLKGFGLWWAAWTIGVVLCAAALRACIEAGALLAAWFRPSAAVSARRVLEGGGLAALYLGLPAWFAWRALGA